MKKIMLLMASFLCMAMVASTPADAYAQKKGARTSRTATARKSTTAKKATGAKKSAAAKPAKPARESYIKLLPATDLTAEDLGALYANSGVLHYDAYVDAGLDAGMLINYSIQVNLKVNQGYFRMGSDGYTGPMSLADNKLKIDTEGGNLVLTSPDKGAILDGTFTNKVSTNAHTIAYVQGENEPRPWKAMPILKSLAEQPSKLKGAYITFYQKGINFAFPVDFSIDSDAKWEITSDNEFMTAFGELSGELSAGDMGINVKIGGKTIDESHTTTTSSYWHLGSFRIPEMGYVEPILYIYY